VANSFLLSRTRSRVQGKSTCQWESTLSFVSVFWQRTLTIASLDVSGAAVDAQSREIAGSVTAGIVNLGPGDVTETFEIAFFEDLNDNGAYDSGVDNLLGSASQAGLGAGATVLMTAAVAGELSFAGNLLHAFADSGFVVTESREDNNAASTAPACEFRPPTAPFAPVLKWSWTGSSILPNSRQVIMTPAVADLDRDGIPEIIFASYQGSAVAQSFLRVVSGRDGTELFTVDDPDLRVSNDSSLAVGDIDRDGRGEIIAVAQDGTRLMAFEHDGTLKWFSAGVQGVGSGGPALADLDGDGAPEIVIGRQVLNNDGSLRWTGTGGRGGVLGNPVAPVADLDRDGIPEIVGGRTAYRATGAIYWDHPELTDGWNAVANFDDDPFPEVVLVSNGEVFFFEHSGEIQWGPVALDPGATGGPPLVADLDNDGRPEIGVAGRSRYQVFEHTGELKWSVPVSDISSEITGSSAFDFVADVDIDGKAEIVVVANEMSGRCRAQSLYVLIKGHARVAGLRVSPHGLRHACATHLLEKGSRRPPHPGASRSQPHRNHQHLHQGRRLGFTASPG